MKDRINITHSSFYDFVFNFTDESHFFLQSFLSSTDFPKKRKHQNVYKIFFACPQITSNPNSTPYIETIELPLFAHGVGGKQTPKDLAWFCEVQALFLAFLVFEVLNIRMHEKKSLFELNEKVLRSSFKIIFGVRTARVFELKKNLPYYHQIPSFFCSSETLHTMKKNSVGGVTVLSV